MVSLSSLPDPWGTVTCFVEVDAFWLPEASLFAAAAATAADTQGLLPFNDASTTDIHFAVARSPTYLKLEAAT